MRLLSAAMLVVAVSARADIRFVTPLDGSQAFGRSHIEVTSATPNIDRVEFYVDGTLAGVARSAPYRIIFDFGESGSSRKIAAHLFADRYTTRETAQILTAALTASESIDVDLVEVPFRAVTRKTRLATSDLTVRENGVDQKLREVLSSRGPTTFYFVVDRSLSMGGGKLQKTLQAIETGLTRLRPDDDAHLLMFNHRIEAARELGTREKVATRFQVTPSGGTSLRDALASIQPTRRTIAIVISDGADRNSSLAVASALQKVTRTKLTVYALLLGGGSGADFLETAARRTGGSSTRSSASTLAKDLAAILHDINSRYVAVYQSSGTAKGWRDIQILPRTSAIQIASARRGYYAE